MGSSISITHGCWLKVNGMLVRKSKFGSRGRRTCEAKWRVRRNWMDRHDPQPARRSGKNKADDVGQRPQAAGRADAAGLTDDGQRAAGQHPDRPRRFANGGAKPPAARAASGFRLGADEAIAGRRHVGVGELRMMAAVAEELEARQPAGEFDGNGFCALVLFGGRRDVAVSSAASGSSKETVMAIPSLGELQCDFWRRRFKTLA